MPLLYFLSWDTKCPPPILRQSSAGALRPWRLSWPRPRRGRPHNHWPPPWAPPCCWAWLSWPLPRSHPRGSSQGETCQGCAPARRCPCYRRSRASRTSPGSCQLYTGCLYNIKMWSILISILRQICTSRQYAWPAENKFLFKIIDIVLMTNKKKHPVFRFFKNEIILLNLSSSQDPSKCLFYTRFLNLSFSFFCFDTDTSLHKFIVRNFKLFQFAKLFDDLASLSSIRSVKFWMKPEAGGRSPGSVLGLGKKNTGNSLTQAWNFLW